MPGADPGRSHNDTTIVWQRRQPGRRRAATARRARDGQPTRWYAPRKKTSGSPSGSASICVTAPTPIVWSPAGCRSRRSQASQASAPSRTGTPWASMWVTASNFSRATRLEAKTRARSSWPARSTLTAKRREPRTADSVREPLSKATSSSTGSSDSEATAFVVSPAGPSGPLQVTIATPVANCPMTWRKRSGSGAIAGRTLRGARGAQCEEGDDDCGERRHAELAAHDGEHDRALAVLVQAPDRPRVLEPARLEHRRRRGDAELLAQERDRHGQQRVEPEQPVG